jgi:hypothetical protein
VSRFAHHTRLNASLNPLGVSHSLPPTAAESAPSPRRGGGGRLQMDAGWGCGAQLTLPLQPATHTQCRTHSLSPSPESMATAHPTPFTAPTTPLDHWQAPQTSLLYDFSPFWHHIPSFRSSFSSIYPTFTTVFFWQLKEYLFLA